MRHFLLVANAAALALDIFSEMYFLIPLNVFGLGVAALMYKEKI